jgi:beta-phosphoglucomutase-like phosphatase (HAD superfamily)
MGCQPSECVVIEDTPIGVDVAIKGGFDVFGLTTHDYNDELKKKATKTFDSILKLPELLEC